MSSPQNPRNNRNFIAQTSSRKSNTQAVIPTSFLPAQTPLNRDLENALLLQMHQLNQVQESADARPPNTNTAYNNKQERFRVC